MKLPYAEFDLSGLHSYPLASRPSKVRVADFARPDAGRKLADVADAFPDLRGGADFKAIVAAMRAARAAGRPIIWGLGAHVIKTGLAPILIDLMERGFVSALALNADAVVFCSTNGVTYSERTITAVVAERLVNVLQISVDGATKETLSLIHI